MATNQTTNYNLSQWQPNDPVLRADFNADNQKVDAALAAKGNCRIVAGTYVGTGKYGQTNPNKLTFDAKPLAIFAGTSWKFCGTRNMTETEGFCYTNAPARVHLVWEERSVSWFSDDAVNQSNTAATTYPYLVLLAAD